MSPDNRVVLAAPHGNRSDLTLYGRWGDWFAWLCVAGAFGFALALAVAPLGCRLEQLERVGSKLETQNTGIGNETLASPFGSARANPGTEVTKSCRRTEEQ